MHTDTFINQNGHRLIPPPKKNYEDGEEEKKRYLVASILIRLIERCLCSANQSIDSRIDFRFIFQGGEGGGGGGGVRLKMLMESLTGNYGNDK